MTHEAKDAKGTSNVAETVSTSLVDGYLPCAVAFKVARKLRVSPGEIGEAANSLKIRIIDCQMGFFALKKTPYDESDTTEYAGKVRAEEMEASLLDGRLPCAEAFKIARRLKVAPKEVGHAANKLKVNIAPCQLGCFP